MMKRDRSKAPEASATGLRHFLFLRSTFALLLVGMFITLGRMAWSKMVRENYPDLAIPMGIVTTEWPGASPDQIEKQISQEIEKVVRGLNGLKRVQSGSFDSYSVVTVEFHADEDSTESMNALRAKLAEAEAEFPAQAKKPKLEQVSVNDTPIVSYMLYGDLPVEIRQQTAKSLKKKLEQVPGVRKVNIAGERERTVYVRLYPDRLRSLKISPLKVKERIEAANLDGAWGAFESDEANSQLQFEGRFEDLTRLRQLDIKRISNDRIVRLGEITLVEARPEKAEVLTAFSSGGSDFQPGVGIDILKVSGGDTLAIIDSVRQRIALEQTLPTWSHGLNATITTNEGDYIHESFNDIFRNVWQAMLAVFTVLLLLLTWRGATMAGLAIPLTLLATLGIQMFMGYTLNSMIIIGMVLALGMLVDVFILVMEGMHDGLYNKKLGFAGVRILLSPDLGGASPEDPIQIVIKGSNIHTLMELSRQVQDKLRRIPGTTDVRDNIGPKRQQFSFSAIPEALSFYGLTEDELIDQIRTATAFDEIGKFKQYGVQDDFPIRLGTYWSSRGKSIGGPMYYDELENCSNFRLGFCM